MSSVEEIRERQRMAKHDEKVNTWAEWYEEDVFHLLEIAEAARELFDGDGSYAGSVAETIEQVFRKHGSELGQEVVSHHLARLRDALEAESE